MQTCFGLNLSAGNFFTQYQRTYLWDGWSNVAHCSLTINLNILV